MKAEERKDAPHHHPLTKGAAPAVDHHHAPTVAETLGEVFKAIQSSISINPRLLGLILALLVGGGAWWYLAREGRKIDSRRWTELEQLSGLTSLEDFAAANVGTVPGKVARLEEARKKFGPDGVNKFTSRDGRAAALKSVAAARDEFAKLAEEFSGDATLRAECLRSAAEAELTLVGTESKGSVEEAVKYLRALAATVGPDTAAGQRAAKRADDLEKNANEVRRVGEILSAQMTPPALPDIKLPPSLTPSAPSAPVETPKAPEGEIAPPPPPSDKALDQPTTPPPTAPVEEKK